MLVVWSRSLHSFVFHTLWCNSVHAGVHMNPVEKLTMRNGRRWKACSSFRRAQKILSHHLHHVSGIRPLDPPWVTITLSPTLTIVVFNPGVRPVCAERHSVAGDWYNTKFLSSFSRLDASSSNSDFWAIAWRVWHTRADEIAMSTLETVHCANGSKRRALQSATICEKLLVLY